MATMQRLNYRHMFFYLIVATLLFCAGWLTHSTYNRYQDRSKNRRVALQGFRFTSPLLDVELPEGIVIGHEPIPFKYKIESFIQKQINNGQVRHVSVYYRDLHDGPWFGINEKTTFNPASMMKVPVMIAWLKRAERDPQVMKRTFTYDGKQDVSSLQDILPQHTITPGRRYTVEELLDFMMRYSDNNAAALLYYAMGAGELNAVLDGMDIENHPDEENNSITVHGYSGFFRILYNAAFLNREMSEKALELLSQQDFPQGMSAGVPKGIPVASKFGEHVRGLNSEDKELHEFGIVYHPTRPYILGIMTEGHDFARQAEIIRGISQMIYAEVDAGAHIAGDAKVQAP